jgi:branched-chain amino acid transport system permease protein
VLIALRDNERAAETFGVNVVRSRLTTFALSGFFAALAGGLLAAHQHGVNSGYLGPDQSVQIFLGAVIGGLGSIQGALLGGVYLGVVNLAVPSKAAQLLANSGGVLLVLLAFPSGLGGLMYAARDAVLRRIAIRKRIAVPSLFGDRVAGAGAARANLADRPIDRGVGGAPVPVRFRLPSRIRLAGASQQTKTWKL